MGCYLSCDRLFLLTRTLSENGRYNQGQLTKWRHFLFCPNEMVVFFGGNWSFLRRKTHLRSKEKTVIYVAVAKQVRTCLASPPNVSADTTVFAFFSPILSPVLTFYRAFSACFIESFWGDIFIDIRLLFWHNEFIVICFWLRWNHIFVLGDKR